MVKHIASLLNRVTGEDGKSSFAWPCTEKFWEGEPLGGALALRRKRNDKWI